MEQVCSVWLISQGMHVVSHKHAFPVVKAIQVICVWYHELEEKGNLCPLKKLLQILFCLSSVWYTTIYILFYLFFPPLCSFRQLESRFGLAGGCKCSFQCVTGFFGSGAEAKLSYSSSSLHQTMSGLSCTDALIKSLVIYSFPLQYL